MFHASSWAGLAADFSRSDAEIFCEMPRTQSSTETNEGSINVTLHPINVRPQLPTQTGEKQVTASSSVEEQRARWERKRICTAKELVETEQRYVKQLDGISMYFVQILKARGILQQDVRERIFGPLQTICHANHTLLQYLESGSFAAGFDWFCPQLGLYVTYTDGMEQTLTLLQEQVKKNKSFARFKKLQESRSEFQGLMLEELLPRPLQRIHQYKHLLRDLTENTCQDAADFQQLARSLRDITQVSQYIHDHARNQENQLQLLRVQKLLKGRKAKVVMPGRVYIREGWLTVVPQKGDEVKLKMFFLFSDILMMAKPCHPLHLLNSDKFACQAIYPLEECSVEKVFGHTKSRGGLISLSFQRESLLLMSTDQEDINDWFRCLSTSVGHLRTRSTIVHRKENTMQAKPLVGERKRNMDEISSGEDLNLRLKHSQSEAVHRPEGTAPKRVKLSDAPNPTARYGDGPSVVAPAGALCVIL
ncbi:rho guanine nucleotide exchange factor 39 [Rhinatrema bivittatum]|uniref:rho guanine nucleotide exchange factor 39 n=1 Tax=Rhinatrema bivittatum TaxID=194408 RepID=UPI001125E9F8|nr:rho guanine nucleotide exchange factor 39 [Rhinatrema bivittatum]